MYVCVNIKVDIHIVRIYIYIYIYIYINNKKKSFYPRSVRHGVGSSLNFKLDTPLLKYPFKDQLFYFFPLSTSILTHTIWMYVYKGKS